MWPLVYSTVRCLVTDTDIKYYLNRSLDTVSEVKEKEKKNKYALPCLDQQKNPTPIVVSVHGLLEFKTKVILQKLSRRLASKWELSPFQAQNYFHTHMSVDIVKDTHSFLHSSSVSYYMSDCLCSPFEDGSGISLHKNIRLNTPILIWSTKFKVKP